MQEYKVKLLLTELYETVIEADSEQEALKIADNMDIDEFNETGQIQQKYYTFNSETITRINR
jgi:hypothetical protein